MGLMKWGILGLIILVLVSAFWAIGGANRCDRLQIHEYDQDGDHVTDMTVYDLEGDTPFTGSDYMGVYHPAMSDGYGLVTFQGYGALALSVEDLKSVVASWLSVGDITQSQADKAYRIIDLLEAGCA